MPSALMTQFYAPQEQLANIKATEASTQTRLFELQQAQKQSALLDQESAMLREQADITPTLGGITKDGEIVSPVIQQLKNTAKIQAKLGNVEGYRKSLKDIIDAENKESEILQRNANIQKEQAGYKAGAAQYALDNNDVEGGLAIMAKYDPVGAMRMYAAAPKGPDGKIVLSPEIKQALQRTVAENTTRKEAADIQQKQLNEREKEQYRQESLELRRQAQADRRADQAARREERREAREEKFTSKAADYRAASRQAETAHAHYQRRYDSLKKSLRTATTEDEKKVIISDMEDLNSAYEEDKNRMRQEWEDKGLKVKWPGETKAPSLKESGKTKDIPIEISSEEEAAKLPKGTWIKMGNRIGQVK